MENKLNNEHGLTLVELLVVIVISSFILIFATSLISQSLKTQERITAEAHLRDEADIMMAQLLKALYPLKQSDVANVCATNDACDAPTMLTIKNTTTIGFQQNGLLIQGTPYVIANKHVKLQPHYIKKISRAAQKPDSVVIKFELFNEANGAQHIFENEVILIHN